MKTHSFSFASVSLAAIAMLAAQGCSSMSMLGRGQVSTDSAAGFYDKALVSYELDGGTLNTPMSFARIEAAQVGYENVAAGPTGETTRAHLTVEYPHPRGLPGYALARVEIEASPERAGTVPPASASSWSRFASAAKRVATWEALRTADRTRLSETWELDIPKEKLDRLVAEMNQGGFFGESAGPQSGSTLVATIDGARVKKKWHRLAAGDALLQEAHHQGRLIAYSRPPGGSDATYPTPQSLIAYRNSLHEMTTNTGGQTTFPVQPMVPARAVTASSFNAPAMPAGQAATGYAAYPAVPAGQPAATQGMMPAAPYQAPMYPLPSTTTMPQRF